VIVVVLGRKLGFACGFVGMKFYQRIGRATAPKAERIFRILVRPFASLDSLADALGQEEPTGQSPAEDTHFHDGVEQVLSLFNDQLLLAEQADGQAVPVDDEQVA